MAFKVPFLNIRLRQEETRLFVSLFVCFFACVTLSRRAGLMSLMVSAFECHRLRIKWSEFEPWPVTLRGVLVYFSQRSRKPYLIFPGTTIGDFPQNVA